ncbi:MAG TPA: malonic semialdehyde reductase [Micromonosporaceae bacterium]|nr:malonic semialdehyde reductase [Micromonosporaceae bacterium]
MTDTLASRILIDADAQDRLFRLARSSTEFTDEPVDDAQLRAIYDLFRYAPTSYNQQPLRIIAVRSAEARSRLLPHLTPRNRMRAANSPLVLILAADIDFHERLPEVFPHVPQLRDKLAPMRDERTTQARYNAVLQIGFLIVAIRAAGLAAGPILGFDAAAVDREFFPDGRWQAVLVMNVGRGLPKGYARLPRLSYEDVVREV